VDDLERFMSFMLFFFPGVIRADSTPQEQGLPQALRSEESAGSVTRSRLF
jgi:hypothetical protein